MPAALEAPERLRQCSTPTRVSVLTGGILKEKPVTVLSSVIQIASRILANSERPSGRCLSRLDQDGNRNIAILRAVSVGGLFLLHLDSRPAFGAGCVCASHPSHRAIAASWLRHARNEFAYPRRCCTMVSNFWCWLPRSASRRICPPGGNAVPGVVQM